MSNIHEARVPAGDLRIKIQHSAPWLSQNGLNLEALKVTTAPSKWVWPTRKFSIVYPDCRGTTTKGPSTVCKVLQPLRCGTCQWALLGFSGTKSATGSRSQINPESFQPRRETVMQREALASDRGTAPMPSCMPSHWRSRDHSHIPWSQRSRRHTKPMPHMTPSPQPHTITLSEIQSRIILSKRDVSPSKV